MSPREPFVGTEEAAEFLGKPASWLYNSAERIGVPRYRVGLHWRYRLGELEEWVINGGLDSRPSVEPTPKAPPAKRRRPPIKTFREVKAQPKPEPKPEPVLRFVTVEVSVFAVSDDEAETVVQAEIERFTPTYEGPIYFIKVSKGAQS